VRRNSGRWVPPVTPRVVQRLRLRNLEDERRATDRSNVGAVAKNGGGLGMRDKRKLVLGISAGVVAIVAAVAAAASAGKLDWLPVFGGSGETSESVPAAAANELARRFAPVLRLAAGEPFVPLSRKEYLSVAALDSSTGGPLTITRPLSLPQLPVTPACPRRCRLFLDLDDTSRPGGHTALGPYRRLESRAHPSGTPPTVYYHVLHWTPSNDYTVQYWFLYLFNSFPFDHHESDWEDVIVRVSDDKSPEEVFFSTHARGRTAKWTDVESTGDHPVVYPARGSHANYANTGRRGSQPVLIACKAVLHRLACFSSHGRALRDRSDGCGTTLGPQGVSARPRAAAADSLCASLAPQGVGPVIGYTLRPLTWPAFAGNYGPYKNKFFRDPQRRPVEWPKALDWLESAR
jgi:Vacuolar protein sorting-associated protein 62